MLAFPFLFFFPAMSCALLGRLSMHSGEAGTSASVSILLSKALAITGVSRSNPARKGNEDDQERRLRPAKMAFSAKHTEKMILCDAVAAERYLSLPASNYSLLDSQLVSRGEVNQTDNVNSSVFHLALPLSNITTALPGDITLRTYVVVQPEPLLRRVTMRSGPLTIASETEGCADTAFLPEWLVRGGGRNNKEPVQLSTQGGFELYLSWTDPVVSKSPGDDVLPVDASVRVWFDIYVHLQERYANTVNNPFANIFLSQAGALTVKAALQGLAPSLAALLVKDFEARRQNNADS